MLFIRSDSRRNELCSNHADLICLESDQTQLHRIVWFKRSGHCDLVHSHEFVLNSACERKTPWSYVSVVQCRPKLGALLVDTLVSYFQGWKRTFRYLVEKCNENSTVTTAIFGQLRRRHIINDRWSAAGNNELYLFLLLYLRCHMKSHCKLHSELSTLTLSNIIF